VGPDGRVAAAEALRGITVFADARPAPALVGLSAAELAGGMDVPGLPPRVLAAAHSAAAIHPDRSDNGQRLPDIREGVGSNG
jgi:hypothetical protein